jgi:uncharacterized membrane protein YfcA
VAGSFLGHGGTAWLVLTVAALFAGFAKTAIGGLGTVAVALVAAVIPARESTAALLLLLLVGDVLAVSVYRRDCDWHLLRHLVPAVVPGLVLGSVVLAVIDDATMRIGLGVLLLVLLIAQMCSERPASVLRRHRPTPAAATTTGDREGWSRTATAGVGVAAGVTTMVANAAGPVMTLYLVAQGVDKRRFLGTGAWFFLGVNLCKLPFSVGLGLVDEEMLRTTAVLAPVVLLGGLAGLSVVRRIGQRSFDRAVLSATVVSAAALLVR